MTIHLKRKSKISDIYVDRILSTLVKTKTAEKYIGNLEIVLRDFVMSVQQRKNEKILEISRNAGTNYDKRGAT